MWSFDSFYDDFAVSALCGGAPSFVFWRHPLCLCNQASVSALCTPTIWPQPFMAGCSKESKKKLLLIMTVNSQPDLVVDFVTHDNTSFPRQLAWLWFAVPYRAIYSAPPKVGHGCAHWATQSAFLRRDRITHEYQWQACLAQSRALSKLRTILH